MQSPAARADLDKPERSKAEANVQATDVAGRWASRRAAGRGAGQAANRRPGERKQQPGRPTAGAASAARPQPAPPRCRRIKRNTCQCTGRHGPAGRTNASTQWRSRSPVLPARRWTLPRTRHMIQRVLPTEGRGLGCVNRGKQVKRQQGESGE